MRLGHTRSRSVSFRSRVGDVRRLSCRKTRVCSRAGRLDVQAVRNRTAVAIDASIRFASAELVKMAQCYVFGTSAPVCHNRQFS